MEEWDRNFSQLIAKKCFLDHTGKLLKSVIRSKKHGYWIETKCVISEYIKLLPPPPGICVLCVVNLKIILKMFLAHIPGCVVLNTHVYAFLTVTLHM